MNNKFKNNFLKNIDFKQGKITYNDFEIDPTLSFEKLKWSFKEDLIQINFYDTYILDIGWYPEFDINGSFTLEVIKNEEWDHPIFEKKCKDYNLLKTYLQEAINFIDNIDKAS